MTAVDILPGNAGDNTGVLELVEQSEENTGIAVEETIGDAAYGDGGTGRLCPSDRTLKPSCRVVLTRPTSPRKTSRSAWRPAPTCPAGNVTHTLRTFGTRTNRLGQTYPVRVFNSTRRSVAYARCGPGLERAKAETVTLHPQEALLQQARAFHLEYPSRRQVVEHRLPAGSTGSPPISLLWPDQDPLSLLLATVANHPGGYQDGDDVPVQVPQ